MVDKHTEQLSIGQVDFAEIRKDIQALTISIDAVLKKVNDSSVNWVHECIKAFIFWIIPIAGASWIVSLAKTITASQGHP